MAKLFDFEQKEIQKQNLVKTLISIGLLFSILFACYVTFGKKEQAVEEAIETPLGVHVKGAVKESGFYKVPFGTRVMDLEGYVGGFCENADLDSVNLAGYVYDGEEVYIPYKGSEESGAINLNTATEDELKLISGIGEKTAESVLHYRETHNGFTSVLELKEILNEKTYKSVCEKFCVE